MTRRLPSFAVLLGLAGLLPFIACGLLATTPSGARGAQALVAYGAVILAFLGGVHWGFALLEPSGRGERARLSLGVLPSLVGWVALLLSIAVNADAGLGVLLIGFIATTLVEARGAAANLIPAGYMRLRYGLSGVVVTVLAIVLVFRLLGVSFSPW